MRNAAPAKRAVTRRLEWKGFTFPAGSYPEKSFQQQEGYDSKYMKEGEYFYYQISVSHERILATLSSIMRLFKEKALIVTQIHTDDYYREHDTYISEKPVKIDSIIDWIEDWEDVVLDDGFFGIGVFSEGHAAEVFLDEHKTIHVYHHDPDLMENLLERLGIEFVLDLKFFWDEPHYHEPLPLSDDCGDDYLTAFEDLADRFELFLDEEDDENIDEDGAPLGITCWKVEIRGFKPGQGKGAKPHGFYSTMFLNASSREEAVNLIETYMETRGEYADLYLQMARVPEELLVTELRKSNPDPQEPSVWFESKRFEFDWDQPHS